MDTDFNPLPRKEGDITRMDSYGWTRISIHSLVKRETVSTRRTETCIGISIHSLVKRETEIQSITLPTTIYFNPLPRKEGDAVCTVCRHNRNPISIHSLVKRETELKALLDAESEISIHSLVKRETLFAILTVNSRCRFQSTPS